MPRLWLLIARATRSPGIAKFYIICFMLLMAMEGVYDEVESASETSH
jgi:hypothetical protein